jgi:phosphoribosyl-AMP cyclohydrolase
LLIKVDQIGGACHDGYRSCFYTQISGEDTKIVGEKVFEPEEKYTKSK